MTKYCKEHVPEGAVLKDMTWGKCSVCGAKGGVVIVKTPGTFKDEVLEPELEIVGIVQEMALEEESEPIVELKGKVLNTGILMSPTGAGTETPVEEELPDSEHERIHNASEVPVEAEPEPSVEEVTIKVKLDTTEADAQISAKEAEIEALKAKLAELEK